MTMFLILNMWALIVKLHEILYNETILNYVHATKFGTAWAMTERDYCG